MKTDLLDVQCVVLFGSYSTGLNNPDSDIDICVICDSKSLTKIDIEKIASLLPFQVDGLLNITSYPETTLDKMLEYGSLFLWHLRLEGKILFGELYFEKQISKLKIFDKHAEEIAYHQEIFDDLSNSNLGKYSYFDMATLFTISRNTCMILSHKLKYPKFDRIRPFEYVKSVYAELPMKYETYLTLSKFKVQYERHDSCISEISDCTMENYYYEVDQLLNFSNDRIRSLS